MQREGDDILQAARLQAERMVQRTEIVREAQATARRTVEAGRDEARRLRLEAEDYCDQKLAAFEVVLDRTIKTVAAGRERLSIAPHAGARRPGRGHRRDRDGRHPGGGGRLLRSGPDLKRAGGSPPTRDRGSEARGRALGSWWRPVTANPWLVNATLRRQPGARREERRAGRIGELTVAGSVVPATAEVAADVRLDSIDGGIEVAADIRAPWRGECRRCLRPLERRAALRGARAVPGPGRARTARRRRGHLPARG